MTKLNINHRQTEVGEADDDDTDDDVINVLKQNRYQKLAINSIPFPPD